MKKEKDCRTAGEEDAEYADRHIAHPDQLIERWAFYDERRPDLETAGRPEKKERPATGNDENIGI